MPRIRSEPEDFLVEELPLYAPEGRGEHTWIHVEKRLATTEQVAEELAQAAGVAASQVGYAGRKDRVAVARQWFSVPGLAPARLAKLELASARLLSATPHRHRLRLGELRGNRFAVVVREVTPQQAAAARERLEELARRGLPNRFGHQRFGTSRGNLEQAVALLEGARLHLGRRQTRFLLSAFQSAVFNEVLRRRPVAIDALMPGDLVEVHATGALLPVSEPARHQEALDRFEQSATGPLPGEKMRSPRGAVRALEHAAAAALGVAWPKAVATLGRHGLAGARRAVRAPVTELEARWHEQGCRLSFVLPPGSFATVLFEELFGDALEGA